MFIPIALKIFISLLFLNLQVTHAQFPTTSPLKQSGLVHYIVLRTAESLPSCLIYPSGLLFPPAEDKESSLAHDKALSS